MSHQSELISKDIESYLHKHENKELLRFLTCGSVDDGKSTLIGRLLHDSKMIYEDQLAAIKKVNASVGNAGDELDLALLVDGLQAEREQGITIDVAYRYFSTDKRKFIIADTPGHEQYTRNMATGASNCSLAIILIDARFGIQMQTKRHSFITSKLGIQHTIVAINKMDLVDFDEQRFATIKADYLEFASQLQQTDLQFIPMSALKGDNVVNQSKHMPWYSGETLIQALENVKLSTDHNFEKLRFPVQYVNRPNLNFRGYCGTITSGVVRVGDEITVLPSKKKSKVASIVTFDGELEEAFPPMSVTLTLEDQIDISRSDIITHTKDHIQTSDRIAATLVWMSEKPLSIGSTYDIKLLTGRVAGSVVNIVHKIDINTLQKLSSHKLLLNEIALCEIKLERPIIADTYQQLPATGSFIIIDRFSNATVAAGMIEYIVSETTADLQQIVSQSQYSASQKAQRFGQKPAIISFKANDQLTLKQAIYSLEKRLIDEGRAVATLLDSTAKNSTSMSTAAQANLLVANGLIVLSCESDDLQSDYCFDLCSEAIDYARIEQFITDLHDYNLI
ncbi:MAG: bifunctional enzyme CysN/CysC [Osedax symbiont Rs1]|nr:MAG: bifunctional enzyme CysN/CysC [Osedax symbiont Rs1]